MTRDDGGFSRRRDACSTRIGVVRQSKRRKTSGQKGRKNETLSHGRVLSRVRRKDIVRRQEQERCRAKHGGFDESRRGQSVPSKATRSGMVQRTFQRAFRRRSERCKARKDDGSVHCTLSKSDRRFATRSSLRNALSRGRACDVNAALCG